MPEHAVHIDYEVANWLFLWIHAPIIQDNNNYALIESRVPGCYNLATHGSEDKVPMPASSLDRVALCLI